MQLPLTLCLQPPLRLTALLALAHGASALILFSVPLRFDSVSAPLFALVLTIETLIAFSLLEVLMRLHGGRAVIRMTLHRDGHLEFEQKNGKTVQVQVDPATTLMPWMVVLCFRDERKRQRSWVILPDSLSPDAFRQLRLWLRWQLPE